MTTREAWLRTQCALDRAGAEQAVAYVRAGKASLGVGSDRYDHGRRALLRRRRAACSSILHTPFGARINRAWGLALRKRFCRSFNFELQAAATDDGIVISLTEQHAFPLEMLFELREAASVEDDARAGPAGRADVRRPLALERLARARDPALRGRQKSPAANSCACAPTICWRRVFPDQAACQKTHRADSHARPRARPRNDRQLPARSDGHSTACIERAASESKTGEIRTLAVDTTEPSPFCARDPQRQAYAYLDDAPLEERRTRAVTLRARPARRRDASGLLDPEAIAKSPNRRGRWCATPTSCTTPCSRWSRCRRSPDGRHGSTSWSRSAAQRR